MVGQQIWIPYCGAAPVPAEWLARWNLDPLLLLAFAALPALYHWRCPDAGKGRRLFFAAASLLLFILFVSPFCALTSALFSARVVHHVVLTTLAAPLLVAAIPQAPGPRGSLAAWTALNGLVFWAWHAPALYEAALSSDLVYWLMQSSLLGSASGFWFAVRRSPAPAAAVSLLATMVQMGLLGALITFSGAPLYAPHLLTTQAWGYAPLEDQQLGGLIMWAPAAGLYLAAALMLVGRWLRHESRPAAA